MSYVEKKEKLATVVTAPRGGVVVKAECCPSS